MEFKKYQHVERWGNVEVENIAIGTCYVFPKIDGTNASVWMQDEKLQAGSRRRHLSLESDNAGFYYWASQQSNLLHYLKAYPTHTLYGEWLVPHSLKTYKAEAWRRFYVFDVVIQNGDETIYVPYDLYKPLLEEYKIDYIPAISIIKNGSYEQFVNWLKHNTFLIEDGKGQGEGIVIKNYDYENKHGRKVWAKIVTSSFKEKSVKTLGPSVVKGKDLVEEAIVADFVTQSMVDKVYEKIKLEVGWSSRNIPRLLNTVYYDLIREESWSFIKKYKNPVINFNKVKAFAIKKTKELKPELF